MPYAARHIGVATLWFITAMGKRSKKRVNQPTLGEPRSHGVAIHFDDEAKGVVIRGVNKPNNDTVEVYVGNIPIEIDLVQFYKLIDKLSDGECNHIRLACCRGFRKYGFAAISAKKASNTVKKIHGKQLISRELTSYLALRVLPSNASSS